MKSGINRKIWDIFSTIVIILLIIVGSVSAYMYANGYRLNLINRTLRQTGVLNAESIPSKANLYINNKYIGRTPKVVSPVDAGFAKIKITKDEYNDWNKKIPISSEKSSSISPYLTIKEPIEEKIFSLEEKLEKVVANETAGIFLLLTLDEKTNTYNIYKYTVNKSFWDLMDNPFKLHSFPKDTLKTIDLNISNDGKWALMTTKTDKKTGYTLLHISLPNKVITETDLGLFGSQYTISWSKDSEYLILESKQDIFAYKVDDNTKFLLLKKQQNQKYVWSTEIGGFFYYLESESEENTNKYSLIQLTLQGNNKKTILKDIYFQKTDKFITEIQKQETTEYLPITNSPENTRFAGEVESISIDLEAKGFYIKTTYATYWHNLPDGKYVLISPFPCDFLSFSNDKSKLTFFDSTNKRYGTFIFNKAEMDPITALGTYNFLKDTTISDLKWLSNSSNLSYLQDGKIRIMDYDGENISELINIVSPYLLDNQNKYLYQLQNNEKEGLDIVRYQIN